MKILAFDTTNDIASVAISIDQQIVAYEEQLERSKQAESLIIMIEHALKSVNLSYKDIDYLGVTNGPGSFTGIRIGLASAAGILLASNIKGIPISNFDLAYYRARQQVRNSEQVCIILNAHREQVYVKMYSKERSNLEPLLLDNIRVPRFIEENYIPGSRFCIAGSGLEHTYKKIIDMSNLTILPRFPRIKAMHICRYLMQQPELLTAGKLKPLYIRMADAKKPSSGR